MLESSGRGANGVGGRSAARSARTCSSSVVGGAGSSSVATTVTGGGSPRTIAAVSLLWRPHELSSGWLSAPSVSVSACRLRTVGWAGSIGATRNQATLDGWSSDTCTSPATESAESTSSWLRDRALTPNSSTVAGNPGRNSPRRSCRTRSTTSSPRLGLANPVAHVPPQVVLPLHRRRQSANGVLVARAADSADGGGAHGAVAAQADVPLLEDLRAACGVAIEEVGDPPGDGEPAGDRAAFAVGRPARNVDDTRLEDVEHGPRDPFDVPWIVGLVEPDRLGEQTAGERHLDVGRHAEVGGEAPRQPVAHTSRRHGDDQRGEHVATRLRQPAHQPGGERTELGAVVDEQWHRRSDTKPVSGRPPL